jgi:hypothetical protein
MTPAIGKILIFYKSDSSLTQFENEHTAAKLMNSFEFIDNFKIAKNK